MALLDSMSARERRLVSALGGIFVGALLLLGPLQVRGCLLAREKQNDELRQAIIEVQGARGRVAARRAAMGDIASRYAKQAPVLATLIDQSAKASGLEVATQSDMPALPRGKLYTERSTKLTVQKTGLKALATFLESVETSGYPVAITQLDVGKRIEADSFQVSMTISAFDRQDATPAAAPTGSASGAKK